MPGPTITILDYLVELSAEGKQPDQPEAEVIAIRPV